MLIWIIFLMDNSLGYFFMWLNCGELFLENSFWTKLTIPVVFSVELICSKNWNVVYFDHHLGAAYSKRWSKYVFLKFFVLKGYKNAKKRRQKFAAKSCKKVICVNTQTLIENIGGFRFQFSRWNNFFIYYEESTWLLNSI